MANKTRFKLGRINANEDEATVVDVFVSNNASFESGALILILETTKATVEIVAPVSGKMIAMQVKPGTRLKRGDIVFEAEFDKNIIIEGLDLSEVEDGQSNQYSGTSTTRKISHKAEKLAKEIGVDVSKVQSSGDVVKEEDVRRYAQQALLNRKVEDFENVKIPIEKSQIQAGVSAIIFGGSGHARSILQMVREAGYCVVGIIDSYIPKGSLFVNGIPILGSESELAQIYMSGVRFAFIGVGGSISNDDRIRIYCELKKFGFALPPLISRAAHFESSSSIGEATYIFPSSNVGANCTIGNNVIVNQGVSVCHDCKIEDHVHLAPGAILAGSVTVKHGTTIGMGATLMNGVVVGQNSLVHNLVAVNKNIAEKKIMTSDGLLNRN